MPQNLFMVTVFVIGFLLKATIVAGAEEEERVIASQKPTIINNYYGDKTNAEAEEVVESEVEAVVPAPVVQSVDRSRVENNIKVNTIAYSKEQDASSVLGAKATATETKSRASIVPMMGATWFTGDWNSHVTNSYSLGVALDLMLSELISLEAEGAFSRSYISYSSYGHNFNQYQIGGNVKFYLTRTMIQPYIGAGLMALGYENMTHGPSNPYQQYNQWIGAGQLIGGLDVPVSTNLAVGVRGAWVIPAFNRPQTADNGQFSYPFYEEAGAINTSFVKLMGNVKVSF